MILDSYPVAFTQGRILSYDTEALTIDAELLPGYNPPNGHGKIRVFTPEGVSLPHTQDVSQNEEDLGETLENQ